MGHAPHHETCHQRDGHLQLEVDAKASGRVPCGRQDPVHGDLQRRPDALAEGAVPLLPGEVIWGATRSTSAEHERLLCGTRRAAARTPSGRPERSSRTEARHPRGQRASSGYRLVVQARCLVDATVDRRASLDGERERWLIEDRQPGLVHHRVLEAFMGQQIGRGVLE